MSTDDPSSMLRDFVYWVRKRRPLSPNPSEALVSEKTLECVAQGVERFLEGKNPWPKKRGRKSERDTMWKCYFLTCVAGEHEEFPARHYAQTRSTKSGRKSGIYSAVGERLGLSCQAIERHARNARELLKTPSGPREYKDWRDRHEAKWWFYHAVCVEERELKLLQVSESGGVKEDADTLHYTRKEVEEFVSSARAQLNASGPKGEEGKREYAEWLTRFNQRDERGRSKPLVYLSYPFDHPESIALRNQRAAKGLRDGEW